MEEGQGVCVKARLVAVEEDVYTKYVFEVLDDSSFVMVTRVPNWKGEKPTMLQEGFLQYKFVQAGKDTWFDSAYGIFRAYQYTTHYFLDFIPITHVLKDGFVSQTNIIQIK